MGGSPHAITFPLFTSERSLPLPIVLYGLFCSFTSEFTAYNLLSPYFVHYSPSPHIGAIRDLHTQLNSTRLFALPFPSHPPMIPSTALRSEYPFKFQKWNYKQSCSLTYSLTQLLTLSLTFLLTYMIAYLLAYLLVHSLTHLLTYLLTHSLTYLYLLTHLLTLLTSLLACVLTYFLKYLLTLTHSLTCSLTHSLTY